MTQLVDNPLPQAKAKTSARPERRMLRSTAAMASSTISGMGPLRLWLSKKRRPSAVASPISRPGSATNEMNSCGNNCCGYSQGKSSQPSWAGRHLVSEKRP